MPINCNNCNAPCCRHVIKGLDRGDGTCKYFDEESCKCSIYSTRFHICNTDWMYENVYKEIMSRSEYDQLNEDACNAIKANYNVSKD